MGIFSSFLSDFGGIGSYTEALQSGRPGTVPDDVRKSWDKACSTIERRNCSFMISGGVQ